MKKTDNRIPEALLKALLDNEYDGAQTITTLSASSLMEPIRIKILKSRYLNEMELIPEENVFLLIGNSVHSYIDKNNDGEDIERLSMKIGEDIKLSGKIDLYYNNCIYDFKDTAVSSSMYPIKEEYAMQLNVYKFLLERYGKMVDKLYLCYIYRDWSKVALINSFEANRPYPLSPIEIREVEIMAENALIDILIKKIDEIKKCKDLKDDDLPICEDKWENHRNKYPIRCLCYCSVNKFCNYYREYVYPKYSKIADFLESRFF